MLLQPMLHTPERRSNFERCLVIHEMSKGFYKITEAVVMTIVQRQGNNVLLPLFPSPTEFYSYADEDHRRYFERSEVAPSVGHSTSNLPK